MGWLDVVGGGLETAANAALTIGESLGHAAPGVGEVLSAEQALYHAGSAFYDGATGDRDGAINHGTQAMYNAVTAIPVVSEAMGGAELAWSVPATGARIGSEIGGEDADYIPGGFGDILGQAAVGATRAIFGEDDSNWIAEGDAPTGTRRGEIMAGTTAMAIGTEAAATGGVGLLPAIVAGGPQGALLGLGAAELLADDPDGPTSGVSDNAGLVGDLVQSGLEGIEENHPGVYDGPRALADGVQQAIRPTPAPGPADMVSTEGETEADRPADMVFTEREVYGDGDGPDMVFTESETDADRPADMVFTEREVYGDGDGPDMVFTESETEAHRPADMVFTEREVYGDGDGPDMAFTESETEAHRPADMVFTEREVYGDGDGPDMVFTESEAEEENQ